MFNKESKNVVNAFNGMFKVMIGQKIEILDNLNRKRADIMPKEKTIRKIYA
ncbi:MAG: hypothetical protein ACPGQP_00625 [Nitrosopumilus sp.]